MHLLPGLFGVVQVPPAVASELAEGRLRGIHLPAPTALPWMVVRPVRDRTLLPPVASLGSGEKEVIALGREFEDPLVVLDDRDARRYAVKVGLKITGTLGILVRAKERRMLDSIRPTLDRLQALRFRLGSDTREAALRLAGEEPTD